MALEPNNYQIVVPKIQADEAGKTVLFVLGLPDGITEQNLEVFFQAYSDNILLLQINGGGRSTDLIQKPQTATVIFRDNKSADEARKNLNMLKLRGKTIRIMWHEKDNSVRYNSKANLFVKNINCETKAREFYEKFLQFGDIISAKLGENDDGNHNGYGYVSYYSNESADAAVSALNLTEVFGKGHILEILKFQSKNERMHNFRGINKNLYVKNIPEKYTDENIKILFEKFGKIIFCKVTTDTKKRKYAIISYEKEEDANKAREETNKSKLDDEELYVEFLMKKSDRARILSLRVNDKNFNLNNKFKNCNLHIRNLPLEINEESLNEIFAVFGEIKSVKIPKMILVTKIGTEFQEIPQSKGFGYVCFTTQESAQKAKDELTGKLLPNIENGKRPLLIDFFMPKFERKQIWSRIQQQANPNTKIPMINPYNMSSNPFNFSSHPNLARHVKQQQPYMHPGNMGYTNMRGGKRFVPQGNSNADNKSNNGFMNNSIYNKKADDPDLEYLKSLEDDAAKKDYLGEFIFKKIENHPVAQSHNFTIDNIGKITGMILGIDDLNEIIDITLNDENLSGRITEAVSLLQNL